ncbi:MAG TPA: hypothetical protein VFW07_26505 [Parafilimonas sp.]|nr:hypothetical protein [Parafilimonas sp.]
MAAENEQYENKQSFYYLEICCRLISEKFGNDDLASWTNSNYVQLSSLLYRKTSVQISPSTLKRIFGKLKTTERYYPQKATRDALAQFAGFENWDLFILKNLRPVKDREQKKEEQEKNEPVPQPLKTIHRKKIPVAAILLLAVAAMAIVWQFSKKENQPAINLQGVKLICKNPVGGNPHSADFMIKLPKDFSGDTTKFKVNFDDGRREKNEATNELFTYYYEVPGRYYPVLKYNDVAIDTAIVYLETNNWTATAIMQHDTTRVYPVNNQPGKDGMLNVNAEALFHAGVDTNRTFFVHFVNAIPMKISGDNFELTADVVTSQFRPGVRCSQVNIDVYGEKSKHSIMIIKPGCVSWAHLHFSDVEINGETSDLRSTGADLSNGGIIKLRVQDKNVSLFVNNKLTYKTIYHFPLERIYGVDVVFAGIGMLRNLAIKDLKTGEVHALK